MLLDKNKQWESLAAACDEIQPLFIGKRVEHGALVAADGRLIAEEKGVKKYVEFSERDLRNISDGALIHNHPSGRSFSIEDLRLACDYNPEVLYLFGINPKGIAYRYTIHRPKGGWPSSREVSKIYAQALEKVENVLYKQAAKDLISEADLDMEIGNEAMMALAKRIGAKYNRIRV
jgi:hypothetical protein